MVNAATGNTAPINFAPKRKWDTKSRLRASVDHARKLIGYEPQTHFEEGLPQAIEWFRQNWERIEAAASFGPGVSSAVRSQTAKLQPVRV
jgi:UDP-glucose 4-epimerase